MLHHFRFLKPLLARDVDGMSALHYFDAAVQVARNAAREMTEAEFAEGMAAAEQITQWYVALSWAPVRVVGQRLIVASRSLNECRLEMLESDSMTQLNEQSIK